MGPILTNNAVSVLAGAITTTATSLVVSAGHGARFPVLATGEWFPATLVKMVGATVQREVVKVTARDLDVFTIIRGDDDTTPLAFAAGDVIECRITAGVLNAKANADDLIGMAKLAGGNSFSGVQSFEACRYKLLSLGNVSGTVTINLALAGTYSMAPTGPVQLVFTNAPDAGQDQQVYLKITNGAGRVAFPDGTMASRGIAPVLSTGRDMVAVWYDPELNANVVGLAYQDFKEIP